MNNIWSLLLFVTIVISKAEIFDNLPVGTTRDEAEQYLHEISNQVSFESRASDRGGTPRYPWMENEIGYLRTWIRDVRTISWLPSLFGEKAFNVRIGISEEGTVTQVLISTVRIP